MREQFSLLKIFHHFHVLHTSFASSAFSNPQNRKSTWATQVRRNYVTLGTLCQPWLYGVYLGMESVSLLLLVLLLQFTLVTSYFTNFQSLSQQFMYYLFIYHISIPPFFPRGDLLRKNAKTKAAKLILFLNWTETTVSRLWPPILETRLCFIPKVISTQESFPPPKKKDESENLYHHF